MSAGEPDDVPTAAAGADPAPVRWPWLLSDAGISTATLTVVTIGIVAFTAMLLIANSAPAPERAQLQIEAIKYGLGFFAAGGAVAALLLSVRRQRLSERNHQLALATQRLSERNHQLALQAQTHTEVDSTERRVTELYVRAADQLGSEKAAVRLAGLYALERLAQGNPEHRQTVVELFCAYLRMPSKISPAEAAQRGGTGEPDPDPSSPPSGPAPHSLPGEEELVRKVALEIILRHLSPELGRAFWSDITLDLTGARLKSFDFRGCIASRAVFQDVLFEGSTMFSRAEFMGPSDFRRARFTEHAWFSDCKMRGKTTFDDAVFGDGTDFTGAAFDSEASFRRTTFHMSANFTGGTVFRGPAIFNKAAFDGYAAFSSTFEDEFWFAKANISGQLAFHGANFRGSATFEESKIVGKAQFRDVIFARTNARQVSFLRIDEHGFAEGGAGFRDVDLDGELDFSSCQVEKIADMKAFHWPAGWQVRPVGNSGAGVIKKARSARRSASTNQIT